MPWDNDKHQGHESSFPSRCRLNQIIVTATLRREPTVDFQSSPAAGLQGLTDREVLALAAQQGRILVTHDRKTMPTQFADFINTNKSVGVLIVSKKFSLDAIVEELLLIWKASSAEEWINRIAKIPPFFEIIFTFLVCLLV